MKQMKEIYVAVKDKDFVETRITALCDRYKDRVGTNYTQRRGLLRCFCDDTIKMFDECFETSMLGMMRCKARVGSYKRQDCVAIDSAVYDIIGLLVELKSIVRRMVSIKDLPSCKDLVEMSPEGIISCAKDLAKSNIVKASVGISMLGMKMGDVIKIEDIKRFYEGRLDQLKCEIKEKGVMICSIEQFLLNKFNAEIAYCNKALLKAGIGVTKELMDLVKLGNEHIARYEPQWCNHTELPYQGEVLL